MFLETVSRLKLSPNLARPPTIQYMFLWFDKLCKQDSKEVALESFTQVKNLFENRTSCLCGKPLKFLSAFIIVSSFILNFFATW